MGSEYQIILSTKSFWSGLKGNSQSTQGKHNALQDFIMMCQEIDKSVKKIESSKYIAKLSECKYFESYIHFKIILQR